MKFEIEYSNNIESVISVLNNPDAQKFYLWMLNMSTLCSKYHDRKSLNLAIKICKTLGYKPSYLAIEKRTYKELKDFYDRIRPSGMDNCIDFIDMSKLKDEPEDVDDDDSESESEEEEQEEEQEEEEEEEEEQEEHIDNEEVYREEEVLYNNKVDVTNNTEQRNEIIKESKAARHAALMKKKPNVK